MFSAPQGINTLLKFLFINKKEFFVGLTRYLAGLQGSPPNSQPNCYNEERVFVKDERVLRSDEM